MSPTDSRHLARLLLSFLVLASFSCKDGGPTAPPPACLTGATPPINFTNVPPLGSTAPVMGTVGFLATPCSADSYRVALYIHVPGPTSKYICKPFATQPLTMIANNGSWSAQYATGGDDPSATEFRVFLVRSSFT